MRRVAGLLLLAACGRFGFDGASNAVTDSGTDGSVSTVPFAYRKPVTIDRSRNVAGVDLVDFPVAIRVTDADLQMVGAGGKLETGVDLAFYAADGVTPLAFEVDGLSTSGDLLAWVKLPRFSATADTSLYLAFGDPTTISTKEDRAGTWSGGYAAVWHFSEASYSGATGEVKDAIGAHAGVASTGVSAISAGKLGGAASFAGNCANISIDASPTMQPTSVTVSAWIDPADIGSGTDRIDTIVAQDYWRTIGTGSQGYYLEIYRTVTQPEPTFYAADGPTYAHAFATGTNVANNSWFYLVGTYDEMTGISSIYVNGALAGTSTMTGPIDYLAKPVQIGCSSSGWWRGAIDEVTISSGARTAGQIASEYANQVDPAAFATIAATEPTR